MGRRVEVSGSGIAIKTTVPEEKVLVVEYLNMGVVKIKHVGKTLSSSVLTKMRFELAEIRNLHGIRAVVFEICAAGADIKEFPACLDDRKAATSMANAWHALIMDIIAFPRPTVALVNKYALGGGYELALACDYLAAHVNSKIGLPEVNLGLLPGGGGTQTLTRRVGIIRAMWMILTAKTMSPELPWVDRIVYRETDDVIRDLMTGELVVKKKLRDEYRPMNGEIWIACAAAFLASFRWNRRRPPASFRLARHAVLKSCLGTMIGSGFKYEFNAFRDAFETADAKEGVRAFLEKRKPRFQGE